MATQAGKLTATAVSPLVDEEMACEFALRHHACVRPLVRGVSDRMTGAVERVVIPCGSTLASVCGPCAEKARRLRMQQCAEGWHLVDEPLSSSSDPEMDDGNDLDDNAEVVAGARRVRSTRRRQDAVELPRTPLEARTVGRTFTTPDGKVFRPSMFVTLTLGSYGRVIAGSPGEDVTGAGSPVRPGQYDYRRAAVDAVLFPRLFDRWVQNLRRCAGFVVQYFGVIEPQRRLAPHIHLAIRGALPREVIRQVTAATYLQLWWPSFDPDDVLYPDDTSDEELPYWDPLLEGYVDPTTDVVLPTWERALDAVDEDPEAEPAAVLRFGRQLDIKGIIAPSEDANRSIRYLTKYLTKSVSETFEDSGRPDPAYEAHINRLHAELRNLPCSPECANWLRFGIQPKDAGPGLAPGHCHSKAHGREHLGLGGRRVQVSRHWSGKTLAEHRADRAAVVREVLAEAGIEAPAAGRMAADRLADDGLPRYIWEPVLVESDEYAQLILASVVETERWRREYDLAKQAHPRRAGPVSPEVRVSA